MGMFVLVVFFVAPPGNRSHPKQVEAPCPWPRPS